MTVCHQQTCLTVSSALGLMLCAAVLAGCTNSTSAPVVESPGPVTVVGERDRVVLVSEALASDSEVEQSTFTVSSSGNDPVTLQLSMVGCSCYRVLHDDRKLKVGDEFEIAPGEPETVRIESQVRQSPGVMQYRAEFEYRDAGGAAFYLPLASTVRTIADLVVRPDVIHHAAGSTSAGEQTDFEIEIVQRVRASQLEGLRVEWGAVPDWISCSPPTLREDPVEIEPGVWRVLSRSVLTVHSIPDPQPAAPIQLQLESSIAERRLGQTACTLIVASKSGIQAPALIHFGRPTGPAAATKRVQLIARDKQAFAITSIASRDGSVEANESNPARSSEHWLEVALTGAASAVNDTLTVRTDHPDAAEVTISVRALAPVVAKPQ